MRWSTPVRWAVSCLVLALGTIAAATNMASGGADTQEPVGDMTGARAIVAGTMVPGVRGDLNLNGIPYEIGDLVVFSNFMTYGRNAFPEEYAEMRLDAGDIDCDGLRVTGSDFTRMMGIVVRGVLDPCDSPVTDAGPGAEISNRAAAGPVPSDVDTMRILDTSAAPGDTIEVEFYLANVDTLGFYGFRLRYDPAVLEPVKHATVAGGMPVEYIEAQQLRGSSFDVFSGGVQEPDAITFPAGDFDLGLINPFLPGSGVSVRMKWHVLASAGVPQTVLAIEDDPEFPYTYNAMADIRDVIWKRPVLESGTITICDCPHQSDFDEDGFRTAIDLSELIDILFAGHSDVKDVFCPSPRADFDCDGFSTALDLSGLIDHLFTGADGPCDPCAP